MTPAGQDRAIFDGRSFTLLNQRLSFEGEDRWRPAPASDLWAYNLHYFRYLWSVPPDRGLALIMDWIGANPPGSSPGWDPYPISLRLREWIEWLLAHPDIPSSKRSAIVASVAHQAAVLASRPEHHLSGNHLLENAVSLCWAGASLEGPGSEQWLEKGGRLLAGQLSEQLLADGAHAERSPMYQALLVEVLLRLCAVAGRDPSPIAEGVARVAGTAGARMLDALAALVHPDGDYALLNDCALGVAPPMAALEARFQGLGDTSHRERRSLPAAGYLTAERAGGLYLVFDAGPIGPDHQPGHGHADTLGFELSVGGKRLVTDTGVMTYAPGPVRAYDRGTAAHSTVQIDGRDHAELWGSFRCGSRPRPEPPERREEGSQTDLAGGYRARLAGARKLRHRRRIRLESETVEVADSLSCRGRHEAVTRFHLAPGVEPRLTAAGVELGRGTEVVGRVRPDRLSWRIEETPYHPEFGVEVARKTLVGTASFEHETSFTTVFEFCP